LKREPNLGKREIFTNSLKKGVCPFNLAFLGTLLYDFGVENNIKENIAHNLANLRKNKKLTQNELAEKFSYSDKAVSKWEHGEALPSIEVLQQLADFYGVSLDFLTHEITPENRKDFPSPKAGKVNRAVITALAVSLIWILAIVVAIGSDMVLGKLYWMSFVWALPCSFAVILTFNAIWGPKKYRAFYLTMLCWTLIASCYIELGLDLPDGQGWKLWMLFLVGVPATIAAVLWSHLKTKPDFQEDE
jgi:transcriptional regulator with XRE-family HTH domain